VKALLAVLLAFTLAAAGCARGGRGPVVDATDSDLDAAVSLTLESRCAGCHNSRAPAGGLSLTRDRMASSMVGVRSRFDDRYMLVKPGEPEASLLMMTLRGDSAVEDLRMPPKGALLSDSEIDLVGRWITSLGSAGEGRS
jgi:mono/diheme cytochrome c family protein